MKKPDARRTNGDPKRLVVTSTVASDFILHELRIFRSSHQVTQLSRILLCNHFRMILVFDTNSSTAGYEYSTCSSAGANCKRVSGIPDYRVGTRHATFRLRTYRMLSPGWSGVGTRNQELQRFSHTKSLNSQWLRFMQQFPPFDSRRLTLP
eukprot:scaffold84309_cov37-Prasinocladus_malaysianus.AAC.1